MLAMTQEDMSEIRALIERRSGILFSGAQEGSVSARLREHMEAKRLLHGIELLRLVRSSSAEYEALLERLLQRETSFFRYPAVFDALEKKVLPEVHMRKFWETPRNLRIWSAGCASGEEPYSVAITIADTLQFSAPWKVTILATDISRQALQHAERGVYSRRALQGLDLRQLETYFARVGDQFMVKPRIRNLVTFAPMNLAQCVYMGRFDCIFCLEALAYFSPDRRSALVQRFYDYLEPGGCLFLGHADSVTGLPVKFEGVPHGDWMIHQKPHSGFAHNQMPAAEKRL